MQPTAAGAASSSAAAASAAPTVHHGGARAKTCDHPRVELVVRRGNMQGSDTVTCAVCHKVLDECIGTVFGDDGMETTQCDTAWRAAVRGCTHPPELRVKATPTMVRRRVVTKTSYKWVERPMIGQVLVDYCSRCGAALPSAQAGA